MEGEGGGDEAAAVVAVAVEAVEADVDVEGEGAVLQKMDGACGSLSRLRWRGTGARVPCQRAGLRKTEEGLPLRSGAG